MTSTFDRTLGSMSLAGKVALITGGGGGLGRALSLMLGASGTKIVAADLRLEAAQAVAAEATGCGFDVTPVEVDLRDESSIRACFDAVAERHGAIDIVINNAGIDVTVPVTELTTAQWDDVMAVNLRAPFLTSKLAFEHMQESGGGQIVNIVSTAARRAWANASVYHASKWGLLGLSHALHVEGRACGIRVSAIISGGMRTPFLLDRFPEIDLAVLQDPMAVARTVAFVLSQPEGSVIPEVMVLPVGESSWP